MNKFLICCKCGWVHFGLSKSEIETEVETFNVYYKTLAKEKQDLYYGGKEASIIQYQSCFRCGNTYKDFQDAKPSNCPEGSTIQPIQIYNEYER